MVLHCIAKKIERYLKSYIKSLQIKKFIILDQNLSEAVLDPEMMEGIKFNVKKLKSVSDVNDLIDREFFWKLIQTSKNLVSEWVKFCKGFSEERNKSTANLISELKQFYISLMNGKRDSCNVEKMKKIKKPLREFEPGFSSEWFEKQWLKRKRSVHVQFTLE